MGTERTVDVESLQTETVVGVESLASQKETERTRAVDVESQTGTALA